MKSIQNLWQSKDDANRVIKCIHMVGISGAGMSAIADILISMGYIITGSDLRFGTPEIKNLQDAGAKIHVGHKWEFDVLPDLLVYSSAIPTTNIELIQAKSLGIPTIPRGQMLAALILAKKSIALTGSHGKTTTSAMVSWILQKLGFDPSCILGGQAMADGKSSRIGRGDWIVVEGDESDGSFAQMQPDIAVINNIDADHLNHYGTLQALHQTFYNFIDHVSPLGSVIINANCVERLMAFGNLNRRIYTFGSFQEGEQKDFAHSNCRTLEQGYAFTYHHSNGSTYEITTSQPGEHNAENATAALGVVCLLGNAPENLVDVLADFPTVSRRFEILHRDTVPIILDYGHHPSELKYTFQTARQLWPDRELVVVFEPHRYTRTHELYLEFAQTLAPLKFLSLAPIYAANENPIEGIDSELLQRKIVDERVLISQSASPVKLVSSPDELKKEWETLESKSKMFLFQGAGNINLWAKELTPFIIENFS